MQLDKGRQTNECRQIDEQRYRQTNVKFVSKSGQVKVKEDFKRSRTDKNETN